MMKVTGVAGLMKAIEDELAEVENRAVEEMRKAAEVVTRAFFSRTPVWSGETVRNYQWGIGGRAGGAVKGPLGTQPPTQETNRLPLGAEDNRGPNEAAVMSETKSLVAAYNDLRKKLVLTNNVAADKWDLVDNGMAPISGRGRNAGGTSVLAVQRAKGMLEHFK